MTFLKNLRDRAVEALIRNHELVKKFGDIQSLSIDAEKGTATVSFLLHGEPKPIIFQGYYFWDSTENGTDLVVRKITCERQWINEALDYWLGKTTLRFTIPGLAGGIAKIIF